MPFLEMLLELSMFRFLILKISTIPSDERSKNKQNISSISDLVLSHFDKLKKM